MENILLIGRPSAEALKDGRKTELREVISFKTSKQLIDTEHYHRSVECAFENLKESVFETSAFKEGDRVCVFAEDATLHTEDREIPDEYVYFTSRDSYLNPDEKLFEIEITGLKIEKLQNITKEEIRNEGLDGEDGELHELFRGKWDGKAPDGRKWEDNPYTFVYSCKMLD